MKKLIVGIALVLFFFLFLIPGSDLSEVLPFVIVFFLIPGVLLIWFGWKDRKKGSKKVSTSVTVEDSTLPNMILSSETKKINKWEKIRNKGKTRYIFLYGVLLWGGLTGIIMSFIMTPIALLIFPIGGIFYGFWTWNIAENRYRKAKSLGSSQISVSEPSHSVQHTPAPTVTPAATASAKTFSTPNKIKQHDGIGIRFEISKIDKGGYGEECWKVFWRAVDIEMVAGTQLLEGDTNDTPDRENVYCLAIKWMPGSGRGDDVRNALEQSDHYRKVASNPNFISSIQVSREPLVEAGRVDQSGRIVGTSYRAKPALEQILKERAQ